MFFLLLGGSFFIIVVIQLRILGTQRVGRGLESMGYWAADDMVAMNPCVGNEVCPSKVKCDVLPFQQPLAVKVRVEVHIQFNAPFVHFICL